MQKKPNASAATVELRQRAEARLRAGRGQRRSLGGTRKSAADPARLGHELQVHQVELELQNAELHAARDRMEMLLEKYTDLYDFAPVGYFSLDHNGRIVEVNLSGAALLGVDRSRLINQCLTRFVAPASQSAFMGFLDHVFANAERRAGEATFRTQDGAPFLGSLHAVAAVATKGEREWCRLAVSDITVVKRAEESRRRLEDLVVSNQALKREIVRREAVERALEQSRQSQSHLLDQSRRMQGQLRFLSHQILQVQEEERKRISRELHDEITQTLVSISMQLESLVRGKADNPTQFKRVIARTQRLVERSVRTVHKFARELRPTALDDLGLIATLHSFLKEFMKRTRICVRFTTFAGVDRLSSPGRTVLYRVLHSALSNVARHAHANRVNIDIRKLADSVCMEIADNGKSFDVERVWQARNNKHLGLLGMRERVEMCGGKFNVQSSPGHGTTIRLQIPWLINRPRGPR